MTDWKKELGKLMDLRNEQKRLKLDFKLLLIDYQEYQSYFKKGDSIEDADMTYYVEQYYQSGMQSEGLFSMYHQSLMSRIRENKKLRNEISIKLKEIKKLIKQVENENN